MNVGKTDTTQHVRSNSKDILIISRSNRGDESEINHDPEINCEQKREENSTEFFKIDKPIKSDGLEGHGGAGTGTSPAAENQQSRRFVDRSPENVKVLHSTSEEKSKPSMLTKSKVRKCRPLLAYRNTTWGSDDSKMNRNNSSNSSQGKSKDMDLTDHVIKGEATYKLDWPRTAPSKHKDAHLAQVPHEVKLADKKTLNKRQKQPLSRELKTARQNKKPGNVSLPRPETALDSVGYSGMFLQIHQGDKGPAIFEMLAPPIYENLRVSSSAERAKQVQPVPQVKRYANEQRAQKAAEVIRRKQPQRCKGKPRKRKDVQPTRTQNRHKEKAVVISGLDGHCHLKRVTLTTEDDQGGVCDAEVENGCSHALSVFKELLSNSATGMFCNLEQRDLPISPFLRRQIAQLTPDTQNENPVAAKLPTIDKRDQTTSPAYQKFLDDVEEGPVTDDLLRCLAEELISLEEKEVETLKPEHIRSKDIKNGQSEFKKSLREVKHQVIQDY